MGHIKSDILYFTYISKTVKEGGMARNYAFLTYFNKITGNIYNVFDERYIFRLFKSTKSLIVFFLAKRKRIIIHQGAIILIFPVFLFRSTIIRKIIKMFFEYVGSANKLTIEVNDLPYEQSIDLGLQVKEAYREFQKILYSLKNCNYIFASYNMRKYACEKYGINFEYTQVVLNGAPIPKESRSDVLATQTPEKRKFVYAGTLNKGRQIEDMIKIFIGLDQCSLVLLGKGGEWISQLSFSEKNIIYLGALCEEEAQQVVASCDMGLIPYDNSKFYYNLCYTSKASFYLAAGIPILSTPLDEMKNVISSEICVYKEINNWSAFIKAVNLEVIYLMKKNAVLAKEKFTWEYLLKEIRL